jgi:peptidyl-prolyl cis-trans isomerase B (cyclophilin B)
MRSAITFVLIAAFICCAQEVKKMPQVKIETSKGTIVIELDSAKAPNTVANFLGYVKDGFYNGTVFHRVIKGFMVQGGGLTQDLKEKPAKPSIQNEANNGLKNLRGTLAMARTMEPHSASSQFFINTVDNAFLDFKAQTAQGWGYCVFGKVVQGMDVVDKIESVPTTTLGQWQDTPTERVTITKATVVGTAAPKKTAK